MLRHPHPRRPRAVAALLALLALAACRTREQVDVTPTIGKPAPAYVSMTLDGDTVSLAGQRGTVVLLNIWATWCHPCREELPVLQKLHQAHAERGFRVIGVSVDARGEEAQVRDFAHSFGLTFPLWHDPDERVATIFLALGVPASYLIGRDGTLLWRHVGPIKEGDPGLTAALEKAL